MTGFPGTFMTSFALKKPDTSRTRWPPATLQKRWRSTRIRSSPRKTRLEIGLIILPTYTVASTSYPKEMRSMHCEVTISGCSKTASFLKTPNPSIS